MTDFRSQPITATPTPWRRHISPVRRHLCIVAGPGESFTWICGEMHNPHDGNMPRAEAEANADLIVEAVNSHEALKARIQELEAELAGCRECRAKVDCISR